MRLIRIYITIIIKEVESGLGTNSSPCDFYPLIPSEETGVGDQNIQKRELVYYIDTCIYFTENSFKTIFHRKRGGCSPLGPPLNSLMWRVEMLKKSAFWLFLGSN